MPSPTEWGAVEIQEPASPEKWGAIPVSEQRTDFEEAIPTDEAVDIEPSTPRKAWTAATTPMVSPETINLLFKASDPLRRMALESLQKQSGIVGTVGRIGEGAVEAAGDLASSFTSPLGIVTAGAGALPRLAQKAIALGFAGQMATDVPEAAQQAGEATVTEDAKEITRRLIGLGANIGLPALLTSSALKPTPKVEPKTISPVTPETIRLLPQSSKEFLLSSEREMTPRLMEALGKRAEARAGEPSGAVIPLPESFPSFVVDESGAVRRAYSPVEKPSPPQQPRGSTLPEMTVAEEVMWAKSREALDNFKSRFQEEASKKTLLTSEEVSQKRTGGIIDPVSEPVPLKESWQVALERWADEKIGESKKRTYTGLDPELLAAYAVKGAAFLARGVVNATEWTTSMVKEFGEQVRPYLNDIRKRSEEVMAKEFTPKPPPLPTAPPQLPTETVAEAFENAGRERFSDFGDHARNKEVLTEKFGVERIPGIGKLFSLRGKIKDQIDRTIVTLFGEKGIGRAKASAFGEEIRNTIDPVFERNERGEILNIGAQPDQSRFISDVFGALRKDPNAYELNPQQREAFNRMTLYLDEMARLEDKYGLFQDDTGTYVPGKPSRIEGYFPRNVIQFPEVPGEAVSGTGATVGIRPGFLKGRPWTTERLGVEKGKLVYEPSIEKRLVTRAERLYNAIAEKRFFNDPSLGGKTRTRITSELKDYYADELGSGALKEADIERMVDRIEKEGTVNQPGFFSKIYDKEVADRLNRYFPRADSSWRKKFVSLNDTLKGIRLSADLGAFLLQGIVTLYKDPKAWSKGVGYSLQALKDPTVIATYARENIVPIRELAQAGSSVGRLSEMLAGLREGERLTRIPVAGPAFKRFGASFQTFLDVAKVEMWKAYKDAIPKERWTELAQTLESQLASARMEEIGVVGKRALAERAILLAPSYYRGALNQVALIGMSKLSGSMARKAMGAYAVGGLATFMGVGLMIGMKEDELLDRLDPTRSDFMMWDVEGKDGKTVKLGLGGIYRSFLRLIGKTTKTAVEHPGNFASLSSEKNPLTAWLRGHSAPIPGLAWDGITGRDFLGGETDVGTMFQSLFPLAAQDDVTSVYSKVVGDEPQPSPTNKERLASFFGMSSFPSPVGQEREKVRKDVSESQFGKSYDVLSLREMAKVAKETEKSQVYNPPTSSLRQREIAARAEIDREKRILKGIQDNEFVRDLGLKIRSYEPSITVQGTKITLPQEKVKEYEAMVIEEYDDAISKPHIRKRLKEVPFQARQDLFDRVLSAAREKAKARLIKTMR